MLFLENLLALPNALWKSRVFKYLSLSDFVKLDIAATANHICKLLTIQLFEDYSCNKRTPIPHPRLLQWMAKRKVQPRRIILNSKVDQHYVDQLRKLSRCNLNTLYLADINDIQFVDIADIVVELLCLELRSPSLTEDSFNRIQFSKLQWLSLTDNANLTDAGITQITEACQELYYLSFTSCPYITDQTIFTAARNCSSLAGLVLRNQQMVSSAGIKQLMAQMGARSSFTCLKLIECNNVSDDAFVAGLCSSLVHLDIVGNPLVTTHTLRAVATNCPLLEHLDLQRCSSDELTGEGVEYVAKGCLSLSFINLSYTACATASAVTALATLCPRLAFIGLLSASLCGDKQISDLQDLCSRNRQLQILHLGQCDIPSELSLLDFAEAFANCSPKELRVDRVKNLADSFVACISQGCSSLSILDIKDCPDITGVGVSLLCRKLVQLALDTLPLLPVNELLSIARNSWFLQVLTLCNLSDSISDQDFANFFIEDHCAHLSEVFFQNIRIGKTTLQSMPSRKLRKIVVDSTEKFAPIYAIKLVEAFSAIELLFVSSCGSCLYDSSKGTHLLAPAVDALLVDPQQLGLPAGVPVTPATQLANSAHSVNYSLQMEGGLNNTPDPDAHDPPDPPIPQGWWSPRCTKVKYSDVETEM